MSNVFSRFEGKQMPTGRAGNGGQVEKKELPYTPPVGPNSQTRGPGIGGTNHGNTGTQGKR